jgi:hypothetical protein
MNTAIKVILKIVAILLAYALIVSAFKAFTSVADQQPVTDEEATTESLLFQQNQS